VRATDDYITIGGINASAHTHIRVNHTGDFTLLGDRSDVPVYWSNKAGANALSWSQLRDSGNFDLGYNADEDYFYAVSTSGTTTKFTRYGKLYGKMFSANAHYTYATVEENKRLYTRREIRDADSAREFQHNMGYQPTNTLTSMILAGSTKNIPVSAQDLRRADLIYGPAVPAIKGKTRRVQLERVVPEMIPREINKTVRLHADIMFVEGIPFLVTVDDSIGLTGITHLGYGKGARSTAIVCKALLQHVNVYRAHGFRPSEILTDGEGAVEAATDALSQNGVSVNVNAPEDKVNLVERKIGTIKGIARSVIHSLPYRLAYTLLPHLLNFAVSRIRPG
jgi:hypothetical protein